MTSSKTSETWIPLAADETEIQSGDTRTPRLACTALVIMHYKQASTTKSQLTQKKYRNNQASQKHKKLKVRKMNCVKLKFDRSQILPTITKQSTGFWVAKLSSSKRSLFIFAPAIRLPIRKCLSKNNSTIEHRCSNTQVKPGPDFVGSEEYNLPRMNSINMSRRMQ